MTVRVAIIGAGIMGADHAAILGGDIPGATLQLVCDADAGRAAKVAEACGAHDAATDPLDAIARRDVDAVLIASPDDTHAPLTLAALAAGKPVLCEKPLAPTSAEGRQIVEAELQAGRRSVQLGFMRRFDPSYVRMKAAIAEGALGRPIMMHNFHRNVESPPWFTGDMAITNSAPHEFDIARHVLDTEYSHVTAFQPASRADRVAPVFMVLETTAGQIVNIEINNNATYGYDVRAELVGEAGSVLLNAAPPTRTNAALKSFEPYAPDWRERFAEAYRLQNKAWIHAIRTDTPSPTAATAWDGLCATLAGEAGVAALASGRRTTVGMSETPALYRSAEGATP